MAGVGSQPSASWPTRRSAAGATAVALDIMALDAEWPKGHIELVRAARAAFEG